jgi:uncharacterized protein YecE (DUF72 family)
MAGQIRVGIGGWVYEPWRETFYPAGLAKSKELAFASRAVTAIEINATFYRTQSRASFARWAAETPDDFCFTLKASRYCVNRRDLAEASDSIPRFVDSGLSALGAKLGPILWQLAATKKFNADEIEAFLSNLPSAVDGIALRHAIEPRHASFQNEAFVALARRHNVAIVLAEAADYPLIADPTADFCYVRLQTTASDQATGYDAAQLGLWADRIADLSAGRPAQGLPLLAPPPPVVPRDCFIFFIAGAKERNPAAAQALIATIDAKRSRG